MSGTSNTDIHVSNSDYIATLHKARNNEYCGLSFEKGM